MKKILNISLSIAIMAFLYICFSPKAEAITITCSGDQTRTCAKVKEANGTEWTLYGIGKIETKAAEFAAY